MIFNTEEALAKPKYEVKVGDMFKLDDSYLLCGDSTNYDSVARLLNGTQCDLCFTDPPWNVNYGAVEHPTYKTKDRTILNDSMPTEDFKDFMLKSFKTMNSALKEGAAVYVVMSAQEWGNCMLTLAANDFHWSSTIIWKKSSLVLSRKDYHTQYEPIYYGWKNGAPRLYPLEDRKQSDVWDVDKVSRSELHPTMKPIELVARAIMNSSKFGDVGLDLFGGSGSTLIACEQTKRKCYMMELDPKYCSVIVERWEKFTGKTATKI